MDTFYYRRLDVYNNSKILSKYIYSLLKKFPIEERFALCDQLRRAATSIPINIAEGFGRFSSKEKSHFIQISYGSCTEVMCEIELALDLNYITQEEFTNVENQITHIVRQLSKLNEKIMLNGDYNPNINNHQNNNNNQTIINNP